MRTLLELVRAMTAGIQDFKSQRLIEAREARGLTQTALAEQLKVTRAAVSQYESQQRVPSTEVLLRLSHALGMPVHFFTHGDGYEVKDALFFRSMAAATKSARTQARRHFEWLVRIVDYLRGYVQLPEVCIPILDLPSDPRQLTSECIEDVANSTRSGMGLGFGPISNVTWLLENKGAIVAQLDLCCTTLDAFSHWYGNTPFLVLNSVKGSAVRWRYDLAHELGHMILHRRIRQEMLHDKTFFQMMEDQAHRFAGAFLLPESSFGHMVPYSITIDTLVSLKSKWKVSIAAMVMRLRDLSLIPEQKCQRLFIAISRRGWKANEPLDDQLEMERPRILARAAELLVTQNVISLRDIENSLGIPRDEIENLLGYKDASEENIIRLHRLTRKAD